MALSKIDTTNMIEDIPQSKLDNNINFRNIVINGDMSISQRSTSQATAGSSGGSYQTLDRWKFYNNSLGAFTWSQDTDVPTGQGFANSMKFDCTTADASPAAADYLLFQQQFEGQNVQYLKKGTSSAESLTLSFWVKSNKTGTYITEIFDADNSRSISKSYTIDSASTWEKKTLTFSGDTTGTLDNNNGSSLTVEFWLGSGSTYSSGTLQTSWGSRVAANRAVGGVNLADDTANNFWITGVQLEAGQTASEFEFLPFDVNLGKCQRYYEKSFKIDVAPSTSAVNNGGSVVNNANAYHYPSNPTRNYSVCTFYKVRKRAPASVQRYSHTSTGAAVAHFFGGGYTSFAFTLNDSSETYFTGETGQTGANEIIMGWTADAEL